ncbi:MAG: BlaI/MecI/CopY family transcriptional regulator [Eubacteriales bacterium]|nr:BlaI/MecI/CopY family transcriptional regulator [Eubacteriales bacterium]
MSKLPQISQAEFEVMGVVWKYAPISTNEIVRLLSRDKQWSPKTIQTMLSRLEKKGVITHEKQSRSFVYSSIISREAYRKAEQTSFLKRFFDGAVNQLVVSYLDDNELSDEELDALQAILDKKRGK